MTPENGPTAAVIGGGPAGLMAAEVLATADVAVTVYEHKRSIGRKLVLAGRGGLNVTHSEPQAVFMTRYASEDSQADPLLASALTDFDPNSVRRWCSDLGEPTFVGSSGRIFPQSFTATPLLRAWLARLTALGVTFEVSHRWTGFDGVPGIDGPVRFSLATTSTTVTAAADVAVLALGGASWPRVGSDGGWVEVLRGVGIDVATLEPANSGIAVRWSDHFSARFAGVPLKNVAVSAGAESTRGDCMITAAGLEGGPIYAQSRRLRNDIQSGEALVTIDISPDLSADDLAQRLRSRRQKDSASTWLRKAGVSPVGIGLLREATANSLPAEADSMSELIKGVPINVASLMGLDRAISSAGGIAMSELDAKFMLAQLPRVFACGEMLDWEAPTGGYLLQACLSTGFAAGNGAVALIQGS